MCIKCKEHVTSEETITQLKKALEEFKKDPDYFKSWNTTSVAFILYSSIWIDGPEARQLALELLQYFKLWLEKQPVYYMPDSGLVKMFHPKVIDKLYLWANDFQNPSNLSNHELFNLLSMKIDEFEKEQNNDEFEKEQNNDEFKKEQNNNKYLLGFGISIVIGIVYGLIYCIKY